MWRHSRKRRRPRYLIPDSKSLASDSAVISSGEQVTPRSEVRADNSVYLDETLGVLPGFEPAHASLPFTRRLMGVLGAVV